MTPNSASSQQIVSAHQHGRLLIMAGGTGGHVFPALAVAQYLRERGVTVHWMGTSKGIEAKIVPENDIPLHLIEVAGIRGKSFSQLLTGPLTIVKAIASAKRVIGEFQPSVVLGMGGYASGPGGIAARLCRVPLIIHEQNAKPGSTNKVLSRFSKRILCGFPNALPKGVFVGNPVRESFYQQVSPALRPARRVGEALKLLVLGGSLGAKALNEIVPASLALIPKSVKVSVVHQSGARTRDEAHSAYEKLSVCRPDITWDIPEFIQDVANAMADADLIICRAGALTVAEIAAVGCAAIFVPFPHAIDDHQTANAKWLSDIGAALLCPEADLTAEKLAGHITQLSSDAVTLKKMANLAFRRETKSPTVAVADYCLEYLNV